MVSGRPNYDSVLGEYVRLEAVHVFPFARQGDYWRSPGAGNSSLQIDSERIHAPENGTSNVFGAALGV